MDIEKKTTIEKINTFNEKVNKSGNLVRLKRVSKKEDYIEYVVLRATIEEIKELENTKELPRRQYQFLIDEFIIEFKEDINGIIYVGNLEDCPYIESLVYMYPQRRVDIRENRLPFYKDYSKTKEEQDNIKWLVNSTPTYKHSWNTVIRKIGKQGIILKIKRKK
jgi:hypothetical protein